LQERAARDFDTDGLTRGDRPRGQGRADPGDTERDGGYAGTFDVGLQLG